MKYLRTGATRSYLYQAEEGKCHYCNVQMNMQNEGKYICTIDHVITKSKGGTDYLRNLVGACWTCNNKRGNIEYAAFKLFITLYGPTRPIKEVWESLTREEYLKNANMWAAIMAVRLDIRQRFSTTVTVVYAGRRPWLAKTRSLLVGIVKKHKENGHEWVSSHDDFELRSQQRGNGLGYIGQWFGIGSSDLQGQVADNAAVSDTDSDLSPA